MTDPHDHSYAANIETGENSKQESSQEALTVRESTIATLTDQLEQATENHLRSQADWSNLLKRKELEKDLAVKHAQSEFLKEFVFVLDSLESGLFSVKQSASADKHILEGLEMIQNQVLQLLEKFDLKILSPEVGSLFDPAIAEAMSMQPRDDCPSNSILMVVQRGYTSKGRILRPARVIVSKNEKTIS